MFVQVLVFGFVCVLYTYTYVRARVCLHLCVFVYFLCVYLCVHVQQDVIIECYFCCLVWACAHFHPACKKEVFRTCGDPLFSWSAPCQGLRHHNPRLGCHQGERGDWYVCISAGCL